MLDMRLSVSNPFRRTSVARSMDWICQTKPVMRNKSLEVQLSRWSSIMHLFEIEVDTRTTGRDHAGPRFYASLLGFFLSVHIYDHRHWDHDNDRWEGV